MWKKIFNWFIRAVALGTRGEYCEYCGGHLSCDYEVYKYSTKTGKPSVYRVRNVCKNSEWHVAGEWFERVEY